MSGFGKFVFGALRIATAIFIACVLLIVAAMGYYRWEERTDAENKRPLAVKKEWGEHEVAAEIKVAVATAWRDGNLFFQLNAQNYNPKRIVVAQNASLILRFSDAEGFKLFDHEVPLSAMTKIVGLDDEPAALSWNADTYVDIDRYRRATQLTVLWRGIDLRKPIADARASLERASADEPKPLSPLWKNRSAWRKLAVGLAEDDVRRILGEPTRVDRYGATLVSWRYGGLLDGGDLNFSRGHLTGWREPN